MEGDLGRSPAGLEESRLPGRAAAVVGAFLLWYALWTIVCNALVLLHFHYAAFLWAPILPTVATAWASWRFGGAVAGAYRWTRRPVAAARPAPPGIADALGLADTLVLAGAFVLAAAAADIGNRWPSGIPYILATAAVAVAVAWLAFRRDAFGRLQWVEPAIGWRLPALVLLLFVIYFFSHRIDGDDANFVNMAIGAQRTAGAVYQLDTMLGDGPSPIHLPTYKFHSFELLGAVLSSYTGLTPIATLHLLIPALLLPLLAIVLMLTLVPGVGRYWVAAALLWLAFLFVNERSLGGWGLHGVVRLYQGKGFLVSALLPLIAAVTVRWFRRGQAVDLVALGLANVCAIGFSANGLYAGPAASAFVAGAVLLTEGRSRRPWLRALSLPATLVYPLIVAGLVATLHLALPSEVVTETFAIDQLNFDVWYGLTGRLTLAVLAFAGLGLLQGGAGRAGLAYLPLAMALTLNPLSWKAISAMTGNLGFRIFWSLPAATLLAFTVIAALRLAGVRSERAMTAVAAAALVGSIGTLARNRDPVTTIRWHRPDLKVIRPDWELAGRLAARTAPGCRILAPETYSMLLSMTAGAPHPVFVRSLYLIHYRFTLPPPERALRQRLHLVVDGPATIRPPTAAAIAAARIPIGTVAVAATAPSRPAAALLARELGLPGPTRDGPLLVWAGRCRI